MKPVTICIHYAYPTSDMAKRLGRYNEGAWYYTVAHPDNHHTATPRGATGSYEETARLCGPNFYSLPLDRWSFGGAEDRRLKAMREIESAA